MVILTKVFLFDYICPQVFFIGSPEGTSARSDEQVAICQRIGPDAIRDSVSTEDDDDEDRVSKYEWGGKRKSQSK